ncbi:MAG: DUF3892 domain-containing protein [Armatimonadota bacterium]
MASTAVTIVKVRKNASGAVTHVVYDNGKVETLAQAIKRAQKGGIANFDAVTPKSGSPYLRKAKGQEKGLAELPEDETAKPAKCAKPANPAAAAKKRK